MVNALTFNVEAASENETDGYKNLHTCIRGWSKFERKKFIECFHFLSPLEFFFSLGGAAQDFYVLGTFVKLKKKS